jgi:hypothetical protein
MGQAGSRWVRWMFNPTLVCTLIDGQGNGSRPTAATSTIELETEG